MNSEVQPITIDVVSDVMCPWCLIGKRRLEKALEMRGDVPVQVRWRPFQLDATIPEEGMDRQEYLNDLPRSKRAAYFDGKALPCVLVDHGQ